MKDWIKPQTIFAASFYGSFLYMALCTDKIPEVGKVMVAFIWLLMGFFYGKKALEFFNQFKTGGTE